MTQTDHLCEHGCWEPKEWAAIMDSVADEIKKTESQLLDVGMHINSSKHAENYHTFLTGKIEGLKQVLDFAEGARMWFKPGLTNRRRYR